jgi:hypothetical protein
MRVLKTIVATAVIVLAMTSVAVAGAPHFTRAQDAKAVHKTRAQHSGALTGKQPAKLIDHQSRSHVREAQRTESHARRVHRLHREHAHAQQGAHEAEARHAEPIHESAQTRQSGHSGSTSSQGVHENETSRQQTHETSPQTHVSSGGHDGGHAEGHGSD